MQLTDSAPRPPTPAPLSSASRAYLRRGVGVGGRVAKSYDREKAWPSIIQGQNTNSY
jgi:hypothetical protein